MSKFFILLAFVGLLLTGGCGGGGGDVPDSSANNAPVANAGADQNITTGTTVTLDGSASNDADGDLLSYSWSITSVPAGSNASLSASNVARPTFTADFDGSYVFSLVVNDGSLNSTADSVTITAATANSAPVANAGTDQNVVTGNLVTLNGSASSDADGDPLTYQWSITSVPAGSNASLSALNVGSPTFTADTDGNYVFSLVVNDGLDNSASDSVTITAATTNSAPVANAGADQNIATGSLITLDGSASSDADGDPLSHSWSITSVPAGSSASLSASNVARPTFTADFDGNYVFSLVVNDGNLGSALASVTITAATVNDPSVDKDGDGYSENTGDCNDADSSISPVLTDICGDGIDQDCSGSDRSCVTRTLTIDILGDGSVSSPADPTISCQQGRCEYSASEGTVITLEAASSGSSSFAHWSGCDQSTGTSCVLTLDNDRYASPSFSSPVVYQPTAKELDATAMALLLAKTDTQLTFDGSIVNLVSINVGDILYSSVFTSVAEGLLIKVVAVSQSNGQMLVEIVPASIEDVLQEGTLVSRTSVGPDQITTLQMAKGVSVQRAATTSGFDYTLNHVLLDDDGNPNTVDDQLTISGTYHVQITLDGGLKVGLDGLSPTLKSFKFVMDAEGSSKLAVEMSGPMAEIELTDPNNPQIKYRTLHTFQVTPFAIGPVLVIPELAIVAKAKAGVAAKVSSSIEIGIAMTGGVIYRQGQGWQKISDIRPFWGFTPPDAQIEAGAKVAIGPQLTTKIYGVAGPSVGLYGYLALAGQYSVSTDNYECQLKGGLEGTLGAKLGISKWTVASIDYTLVDLSKVLYECKKGPLPDTLIPDPPMNLSVSQLTPTSVYLNWAEAIDNVGVTGYEVFQDGTPVNTEVGSNAYQVRQLLPEKFYCFEVRAHDAAGNISYASNEVCATTPAAEDTTPPPAPTSLQANADSTTLQIGLSWNSVTAFDLTGYIIWRDGMMLSTTTTTSYTDSTLNQSNNYCYTITAFDDKGNNSAFSPESCASFTQDPGGGGSTVTSATGRVWMDRNLGASQVATAYNDAAAYGDLYQWGRGTDGHEKRTSATTTTLSSSDTPGHGSFIVSNSSASYDWRSPQNDNLWQGVTGTNNPCPSGFRLPTITEWEAERATWSTNNQAGAFASQLSLVSAGYRYYGDGSIGDAGSFGYYWSSSVGGSYARYLDFNSGYATTSSFSRAYGFSARCLED